MSAKLLRFEPNDSTLLLAMLWAGGGPFEISDLVSAYDWINRAVLTAKEMESSLNRLLAAGLIRRKGGRFLIPEHVGRAFAEFRKRRRTNRFDAAKRFLQNYEPLHRLPRKIMLSERLYQLALDEYHRMFQDTGDIIRP